MSSFVKKAKRKLLPDKLEREIDRVVRQADENLKDAERDVRNFLAESEDVLTGKTPDSVAEEMREAEAKVLEELKQKEAEAKKKEEQRATAIGKRIASSFRARNAGRRSLLSGDRLLTGTNEQTQRTLG